MSARRVEIGKHSIAWFGEEELALRNIVDWADDADLLHELHNAVLAKLAELDG